jgi:hypothetical protein
VGNQIKINSIIQKIDQKRGDIPGARRAIERYLGNSSNKDIDNSQKGRRM